MKRSATLSARLTAIIGVLALAVLLVVAWTAFRSDNVGAGGIVAGAEAPEIHGIDTSGASIDLQNYRGQPVIVNFWASWCQPCVTEMPLIDEVYRSASDQFRLISVNVGDTKGTVNEFLTKYGLSFPVLIDATGKTAELYRVSALPATFAIDAEGRIRHAGIGQITETEQLFALFRSDR
ncbi:TlpA family protein disulfide reductase [Cohnella hongkongensis]|uniref:TlpA family protein disulfide reductase n=1 Tax=Cohnella hongkongensis TaxID=178337 RepID=A0ABV9FH38_9BACL